VAVSQESIVVNDWGNLAITERRRTTGAGTKSRFTIDIRANPLAIRVDPEALGRDVADAIAEAVTTGILAITATVSASTMLARRYAGNAWDRGEAWANERYKGGRTKGTRPGSESSNRLFNDSGRLARSVFARANPTEEGYTINVAANRLDRDSFGRGFEQMLVRLRELVPVLRDPAKLREDPDVRAALKRTGANLARRAGTGAFRAVAETVRTAQDAAELADTEE